MAKLTEKYGGSVPRYTSYPTAPEWKHEFKKEIFEDAIVRSNRSKKNFSLYLHIPFCESQCYFCGCNVIISKEHGIEKRYLDRIKEEIEYIGSQVNPERKVVQMAWGGGTPTFLTPGQIYDLYSCISKNFSLTKNGNYEYSIEIDPRVTSVEHLQVIAELGFNRLSMGIQDFNPQTQEAINRIQPYEAVRDLVYAARDLGFSSINFDLIYGLPYQNLETFTQTIEKVLSINPDRIALFNYAHIPSIFPFQKKYVNEETLPSQNEKLKIFELAVNKFTNSSSDTGAYEFIGLDHFAKANDELSIAQKESRLYRNFQGYTTHGDCDLFSMGVSAISDIAGVYKQNHKKLNDYYTNFGADKFMLCSDDDMERRQIIRDIMCNGETSLDNQKYRSEVQALQEFVQDALLRDKTSEDNYIKITVTDLGRFFVRNIAAVFDTYLKKELSHKLFSKAL